MTVGLCHDLFQLREEFDRGVDVVLDEEHSIHDVAALLKEFLRDMPDPLLTRELYTPFINTLCELCTSSFTDSQSLTSCNSLISTNHILFFLYI